VLVVVGKDLAKQAGDIEATEALVDAPALPALIVEAADEVHSCLARTRKLVEEDVEARRRTVPEVRLLVAPARRFGAREIPEALLPDLALHDKLVPRDRRGAPRIVPYVARRDGAPGGGGQAAGHGGDGSHQGTAFFRHADSRSLTSISRRHASVAATALNVYRWKPSTFAAGSASSGPSSSTNAVGL